jgi:hypothetical protein
MRISKAGWTWSSVHAREIFFGPSIGEPRQPNLIHASDDALEQWTVAAMEKEGLTVNGKAPHGSRARGETGGSRPPLVLVRS